MKKCIDCGKKFESSTQTTDLCDECFDTMFEGLNFDTEKEL